MLWFGMGVNVKPADISLEKDAAQNELVMWSCMMAKYYEGEFQERCEECHGEELEECEEYDEEENAMKYLNKSLGMYLKKKRMKCPQRNVWNCPMMSSNSKRA